MQGCPSSRWGGGGQCRGVPNAGEGGRGAGRGGKAGEGGGGAWSCCRGKVCVYRARLQERGG